VAVAEVQADPFPARAGVSRLCLGAAFSGDAFPRASGGLPPGTGARCRWTSLSPRERGSPGSAAPVRPGLVPFPARAGVSRPEHGHGR